MISLVKLHVVGTCSRDLTRASGKFQIKYGHPLIETLAFEE